MAKFVADSPVIYWGGKATKGVRKAPARARREQVQREFILALLSKLEESTRRWAGTNKKETK